MTRSKMGELSKTAVDEPGTTGEVGESLPRNEMTDRRGRVDWLAAKYENVGEKEPPRSPAKHEPVGETTGERAGEKVGLASSAAARQFVHRSQGLRGSTGDDGATIMSSKVGGPSRVGVRSSGVAGYGLDSGEDAASARVTSSSASNAWGIEEVQVAKDGLDVADRNDLEALRRRVGEEVRLDLPEGRLERRIEGPTVATSGATRGEGGGRGRAEVRD